jgi:transcriptional regulator GlxA family with amidase domain
MEVAILVMAGMRSFDVAAALEVLADDRSDRQVPTNRVRLVSSAGQVALDHGLRATTEPLAAAAGAELLVIPGFDDVDAVFDPAASDEVAGVVDCVRSVHARGGEVASLCSGAFLLAETGLLDGTVATTHWRYCERLQQRHPRISVDPTVLFTHDAERRVWTSAGVTAGIDLSLAIVAEHHGASAAAQIARSLVLPAGRRGGQAQYVPVRYRSHETLGTVLKELCDHVRQHLARPWTLGELAALAQTSPRTLQRQFTARTGMSMSRWLIDERLTAARELLESTTLSVDQVAQRVGFGSADLLRKHFASRFGIPPSRYREAFGQLSAPELGSG